MLTSLARNTEAAHEIVDAALASVLRTVCGSPDMLALAHAAFKLVRRVLACGVTPATMVPPSIPSHTRRSARWPYFES